MVRRSIKRRRKLQESEEKDLTNEATLLEQIEHQFEGCADLSKRFLPDLQLHLFYFQHLLDDEMFQTELLKPLYQVREDEMLTVFNRFTYMASDDIHEITQKILNGYAGILFQDKVYLIDLYGPKERSIEPSETEGTINGPHDAFVESSSTNLSLIRRRLKSSDLKALDVSVGEVTNGTVTLLYIQGIANEELVERLKTRVQSIKIDGVYDSHMLSQLIEDHPYSLFPQHVLNEKPDSVTAELVEGKVAILFDGSPSVIITPSTFFDFFQAGDDYYQRWLTGSATRLLRFAAFLITILLTALYVSVTTYQYEMIPESLLQTLVESRSRVPFAPIYEALMMEITLELLREAGARLPTKIGQTIGIVGGIVIGQAAVQAGFTSNVLIIVVASSAISSFVIPSYVMSASIRLTRFGLIILAGILGNFGIMVGLTVLIIHICGLTSAGAPYTAPLSPFFKKDWRDFLIRAPFSSMKTKPTISKSSQKR
ncbi:spore germination protein [Alkalihalobacillus sp. CinArs1]|uniref:spore germination protein n=1 Tax=Alkalihalobacillus sp. CinArs1 TaxID=2995314 RepID=UPI0022DDB5DF|nr:spore germination protein [Alkalihalobacillus sp. CinArs1]